MLKNAALAIFLYLLLTGAACRAENISPKAPDPEDHAALMELSAAERYLEAGFKPVAVEKLQKLKNKKPRWEKMPEVELNLARALKINKQPEECIAICDKLRKNYKDSKPLISAWAGIYTADSYEKMQRYKDAAQASRETALSFTTLDDLQPVLQAQRKLAALVWEKRVDKSILKSDDSDKNSNVLGHIVTMTIAAEHCDMTDAYREYENLKQMLQPGDRMLAIATARLISSELYSYGRTDCDCRESLSHAEELLSYLQTNYPSERWLIVRSKMSIAEMMDRKGVQLPEAEKLLREVIQSGDVPEKLPTANFLLANIIYKQKRYDEAAAIADVIVQNYPYAMCADFANYLYANSLYRAGHKEEAKAAVDALISAYPDSPWAEVAKVKKETFWK